MTNNKFNPNHYVAIKLMNKKKLANELEFIYTEIKILNTLDHPNIVKYYETYDDTDYVYLIMEYINGEEFLTKI